jgi:hypothetical protein
MGGWQACLQMLPSIVDPPIHALTSSRGVSVSGENLCNLHYLVKMPIHTVGSPSPFHLTSKLSSNRDSSCQEPHIFGALYRRGGSRNFKAFRKVILSKTYHRIQILSVTPETPQNTLKTCSLQAIWPVENIDRGKSHFLQKFAN